MSVIVLTFGLSWRSGGWDGTTAGRPPLTEQGLRRIWAGRAREIKEAAGKKNDGISVCLWLPSRASSPSAAAPPCGSRFTYGDTDRINS